MQNVYFFILRDKGQEKGFARTTEGGILCPWNPIYLFDCSIDFL